MVNLLEQAGLSLQGALLSLWQAFIDVIPGLIAAAVIILIGWIIGKFIKHITMKLLQATRVDQWVDEHNLTSAIGGKKISSLTGSFIKWYIIAIFLAQAVSFINLDLLSGFLTVLVLPTAANPVPLLVRILAGMVLVIAGLMIGRYVNNIIEATQHRYRKTAGLIIELAIIYIAAVMALQTVGFDVTMLLDAFRIAFAAFAITIAVVVGVAFGLAFKDDAKTVVGDLRKSYTKKTK